MFVEVALDLPLHTTFTYECPDGDLCGCLVQVPFRGKMLPGVVVQSFDERPNVDYRIRKAVPLAPVPVIGKAMAEMLVFMAKYYMEPIGLCLKLALPGGLRRNGEAHYAWNASECACDIDENLKEKIREVTASGPVSAKILKKITALEYADIDKLCDCGLLKCEWKFDKKRRDVTKEITLYRSDLPLPKRLGEKQKAIVDAVEKKSENGIKMKQLCEILSVTPAQIRRLLELGVLTDAVSVADTDSFKDLVEEPKNISLTDEQNIALDAISDASSYACMLLHGVTGSGKTVVYIHAMKAVVEQGKSCLFILPEIALTPQFCAVFRGYFGDAVAVLHSALGEKERFDTWAAIGEGRKKIAIGPRSVLFAPLRNLGLVIVDEEHDASFKQSESPRYNARDMAIVLAQKSDCPVVLGSATPSLETFSKAMKGQIRYLTLTRRPCLRDLPRIEIVDMRNVGNSFAAERLSGDCAEDKCNAQNARQDLLNARLLSSRLENALRENLDDKKQSLVLLNRRGFSSFVQCAYCGYTPQCPHCSVSLTFHKYAARLRCHYCDFESEFSQLCPRCARNETDLPGVGTERLLELLRERLPGARIERFDRDRAAKNLRNVLTSFKRGDLDILVGTQMLAKGHDIVNVTLVGVVCADITLHLPDFRSAERTFQLLTQVAGRAGRGDAPGRVIIQSMYPDHPVILDVRTADYDNFSKNELSLREKLRYPPFVNMAAVCFDHDTLDDVVRSSTQIAVFARSVCPPGGEVLGPAPAVISRIKNQYRFNIFLKHPSKASLHSWLFKIFGRAKTLPARCVIDVDPYSFL